jgi:hypothetical protein
VQTVAAEFGGVAILARGDVASIIGDIGGSCPHRGSDEWQRASARYPLAVVLEEEQAWNSGYLPRPVLSGVLRQ